EKALPPGVRIRDGAIEINFSVKKQRYFITLPHPPTAEGIRTAAKIKSDLKTKAKWGILTEADFTKVKTIEIPEDKPAVELHVPLQV
ncbi:DUF3596 domain-containing protein, partial [Acinetobacter nosocomialis]|uniref:Arm DNA-binding domain-containing protein n=1 Tax=Acinetobacter nosocomialis TaxID=106654 RepID=UPI0030F7985E